jgi:pyruvate,water dikinase
MTSVIDLASAADLTEVGGKSRNLGVLLRAGFPVPPGFCVTTSAYREVTAHRLTAVLDELDATAADDQQTLHRLAGQAREMIEQTPVPEGLCDEITAAYVALGPDVPVAVRSSATAEDLEGASFAGQQDTYLNVVGSQQLTEAVRRCWASLWTDRAVSYRAGRDIEPAGVALAVVVQRMVDAVAAGVMFTADPIIGTRGHAVIDASPGLGEAVVSGAVNPDHLVVDTATGAILERRFGDKRLAVRSIPGGGTEPVALADGSATSCLTDEQAADVARLGAEVESHYGAPQDTEWALDRDGRFWLTQARPITTLYPLASRPDRSGTRVFMNLSLAQGLTRPITPMGVISIRLIGSSVMAATGHPVRHPLAGPNAIQSPGGRLFVDVTAALRNPFGRKAMLTVFGVMEARAAAVLRTLGDQPRFGAQRGGRAALVQAVGRVLLRGRVPLRALTALISPSAAYRQIDARRHRVTTELTPRADATPAERLDLVEQHLATKTFIGSMPAIAGYVIPGFALLALARRLLRGQASGQDLQTVLRGLPYNVTTEMDLELWRLTQQIRSDSDARAAFDAAGAPELRTAYDAGALPPTAQRGFAQFLFRYGHRAVAEIDLGMPRWSDDPTHLFGVVRNYLALDDPALAPDTQFAAGSADAEAMVADLVARAARRGPLRARLVRFCLRRTRQLAGLRESPKFVLVWQLALLRAQLQRVGAALLAEGTLDRADDVFMVGIAEARRGLAGERLQSIVAANRAAYDAELRRRHIPRIVLSDGTEPEAAMRPADAPEGALLGSPASTGTVTGRARVVLDPVGAHLEPGEILVAPSTDPGWTPLFLTAGGLVMEMGGSNSHGAVVAREYGIPAVVGLADATHKIRTGDRITLDGAAGRVTLAASSAVEESSPSR